MKITFVGDIMCKKEIIHGYAENNKLDFTSMFSNTKTLFNKSDLVFGNMETPITIDREKYTKEQYVFNSPIEFAKAVKDCGIDVVSTANNHCLDAGISGIKTTIQCLDRLGLPHTGTRFDINEKNYLIFELNGTRIGFMAYTYGTNAFNNYIYLKGSERWMVNLFQNQELSSYLDRIAWKHRSNKICNIYNRIIDKVKGPLSQRIENNRSSKLSLLQNIETIKKTENVDVLIMCMHAGGQYNPHVTKPTIKLVNWLLQNGVDWVIGSHEHVVHGCDLSNIDANKLAIYSLGNFSSVAGVYAEPMDKYSEYSIAFHVYFDNNIEKITYSILKSIEKENKKIEVIPIYNLYEELNDDNKRMLLNDLKVISLKFSGISEITIQEEYCIYTNRATTLPEKSVHTDFSADGSFV